MARTSDGDEVPLEALSLRVTGYTVGARGPQAMPGELPPTSGYTYAVHLSVEQAEAMGATRVAFDPPLPTYVDNFLGFPAGTVVPTGYYDEQADRWEASDSGVVLAIVGERDGMAEVDLTGDGEPESRDALSEAGLGSDELRVLAESYEPGDSLWRVPIAHFSSWDCNWPFGPPEGAQSPTVDVDDFGPDDCRRETSGSIIGCEDQTLGEVLQLAGTPLWSEWQGRLGGIEVDRIGLGGFTFDNHHVLDAQGGVLHLGSGRQRSAERLGGVIRRIAGTGEPGFSGDGADALAAQLDTPHGLVVRPDGAALVIRATAAPRSRLASGSPTRSTSARTARSTSPIRRTIASVASIPRASSAPWPAPAWRATAATAVWRPLR